MSNTKEQERAAQQCQYNQGVVCGKADCEHCGWNPDVAQARLDTILKRMEAANDGKERKAQ